MAYVICSASGFMALRRYVGVPIVFFLSIFVLFIGIIIDEKLSCVEGKIWVEV